MEELFWVLLALGAIGAVVVLPILGAVAFSRTGRLEAELAVLRQRVDALTAMVQAAPATMAVAPITERSPERSFERPPEAADVAEPPPLPDMAPPDLPPAEPPPLPEDALPPPVLAPAARQEGGEGIAARWTVRIGGLAVALAGIYLVQYGVETGLIGPGMRILLALLLAAVLVGGGEMLRRRAVEGRGGEQVPAALSGAGVVIAFGAIFAAFSLYALIGPLLAFGGLALTAFGALLLALRQGPLLAVLGLAGAYTVPLLVSTGTPNALGLFAYLLVVTASSLAVILYRAWAWLVWAAVIGSTGWVLVWYGFAWAPGDALAVGPYLILLSGLFAWMPSRARGPAAEISPRRPADLAVPEWAALAASMVIAFLAFVLLRMDDYSLFALAVFVLAALGWIAAGRRWQALDTAGFPWALTAVLAVAAHFIPDLIQAMNEMGPEVGREGASFPYIGVPPEAGSFLRMAGGFATLFMVAGFVAQWRAQSPGRWALLAGATPLLLLGFAYHRMTGLASSPPFAGAAIGLAVLLALAAERTARHRDAPGIEAALAAYASTALGAVTLALAMLLRDSWLTVAFAWQLPALGWVRRRLSVPALDKAAAVLAVLVLVRLLMNEFVLDYDFGRVPVANGLVIAYGLPLVAFALAARLFSADPAAPLARLLNAGAIAFGFALVTLEIRHAVHDGDLAAGSFGLAEAGAMVTAWAIGAVGLLWRDRLRPDAVLRVAGLLLSVAAAVMTVLALLVMNPMVNEEPAAAWPIANAMGLAYGLPAVLAVLLAREASVRGLRWPARGALAGALLLAFVLVSLEVRRAFALPGETLADGDIGTAEAYSYSAVWLAFAIALFAAGIAMRRPMLRHVGLAALAGVAVKVFLLDMANLDGLYRVASFLGLGLALIAIGWVHQRTLVRERAG